MLELELFWNIALGQINVNQRYILNSNALIMVLLSSGHLNLASHSLLPAQSLTTSV